MINLYKVHLDCLSCDDYFKFLIYKFRQNTNVFELWHYMNKLWFYLFDDDLSMHLQDVELSRQVKIKCYEIDELKVLDKAETIFFIFFIPRILRIDNDLDDLLSFVLSTLEECFALNQPENLIDQIMAFTALLLKDRKFLSTEIKDLVSS